MSDMKLTGRMERRVLLIGAAAAYLAAGALALAANAEPDPSDGRGILAWQSVVLALGSALAVVWALGRVIAPVRIAYDLGYMAGMKDRSYQSADVIDLTSRLEHL